jgi:hypothetical protein
MDVVLDGLEAEFVGRAIDLAAFDSAAGHPHRETMVIVVAAVVFAFIGAGSGISTVGVRPNSPPQITSVLSSIPRSVSVHATGTCSVFFRGHCGRELLAFNDHS